MIGSKKYPIWLAALFSASVLSGARPADKPLLTLDEFFDSVEIRSVKISPDGRDVAVETVRPDWQGNRFRSDLWIYRSEAGGRTATGTLARLTQSGHDRSPEWSPDGRWIAFLSDRPQSESAGEKADERESKAVKQVYLISSSGGEAFAVTQGGEEVHAFAWSADSSRIYFAPRSPLTKQQQEAYKKEWNDVLEYRESERGDSIRSVDLRSVLAPSSANPLLELESKEVASTPYRVRSLETSSDGRWLAFTTEPCSQRQESLEPYAIFLLELADGRVTRANLPRAVPEHPSWAADSRHLFFSIGQGSVEGEYEEVQPRVYWLAASGAADTRQGTERWGAGFGGAITDYAVTADNGIFAAGRLGTEVAPYAQATPASDFARRPGGPGTYERLSASARSPRVAFVYSSLEKPAEVYLAESLNDLSSARPITAFNRLFSERALPQGKPYRWTADDGSSIEGMLIYPPGKFEEKHLPMLTLIHGGPADADGNRFQADWDQWSALAATQGWLVFEPNYHGSIGYGDALARDVIIHIVSRPGREILAGIDRLVKDGIADPNRLSIGGYSYGGYLTNWLITQTSRFKAAVTGAGAVEHAVNWGNDDTTFEDSYYMGGPPWQAQKNYGDEAALWQISKVRTPTHIVAGADDIRVYVGEDYLLERALHTLGVPAKLLIFPGEGHSLDKNPWHGKIKVREELKWLEKYARN